MSSLREPGMELPARFSAIASCQRELAFMAAAAWYRLTFIHGLLSTGYAIGVLCRSGRKSVVKASETAAEFAGRPRPKSIGSCGVWLVRIVPAAPSPARSEERRVGKEGRSRVSP